MRHPSYPQASSNSSSSSSSSVLVFVEHLRRQLSHRHAGWIEDYHTNPAVMLHS
jgi:hypothetical protein